MEWEPQVSTSIHIPGASVSFSKTRWNGVAAALSHFYHESVGRHQIEQLFEKRHNDIRKLINGLDKTTEKAVSGRTELLEQLRQQLAVLFRMKERVIYSKLRTFGDEELDRLVTRHCEEHRIFEEWLNEIGQVDPTDPLWRARFEILRDSLERYLHREDSRTLRLVDALLTEQQKLSLKADLRKEEEGISATV